MSELQDQLVELVDQRCSELIGEADDACLGILDQIQERFAGGLGEAMQIADEQCDAAGETTVEMVKQAAEQTYQGQADLGKQLAEAEFRRQVEEEKNRGERMFQEEVEKQRAEGEKEFRRQVEEGRQEGEVEFKRQVAEGKVEAEKQYDETIAEERAKGEVILQEMVDQGRAEAEKVFEEMVAKGREEGEKEYQVQEKSASIKLAEIISEKLGAFKSGQMHSFQTCPMQCTCSPMWYQSTHLITRRSWRKVPWRGRLCAHRLTKIVHPDEHF